MYKDYATKEYRLGKPMWKTFLEKALDWTLTTIICIPIVLFLWFVITAVSLI